MPSTSLRRKAALFLAVTVLMLPWAANAAPWQLPPAAAPMVLDHLWKLLTTFWSATGCHLDPGGSCGAPTPTMQLDEGCHLDPDGRCGAPMQVDEGCHLDPGGRCTPGTYSAPASSVQGDTGCHLDPSGRCIP